MSNLKFCGLKHRYSISENNLGLFVIIDSVSGSVVQTFCDLLEASSKFYELDGIYKTDPVQLSLF